MRNAFHSFGTALLAAAGALGLCSCLTFQPVAPPSDAIQKWRTPIGMGGITMPYGDEMILRESGGLVNKKFEIFDAETGQILKTYNPKEFQAAEEGSGGGLGAGVFYRYREAYRLEADGGPQAWNVKSKGLFVSGLLFEDAAILIEKEAGLSKAFNVVKIDAATGEVAWRTKAGIEIQESLTSLRSRYGVDYHAQIDLMDGRLYVVSKGMAVLDYASGAPLGAFAFSVQSGYDAVRGAQAGAAFGPLGAMAGVAVMGGARLGEVYPEFLAWKDLIIMRDIAGAVYGLSAANAALVWKTELKRITKLSLDGESGKLMAYTGLEMVDGLGKPAREGVPSIQRLDPASGKVEKAVETGWLVSSAPDAAAEGFWLFTETSAALATPELEEVKKIDFKKTFGLKRIFATIARPDGAGVYILSEDAISSWNFGSDALEYKSATGLAATGVENLLLKDGYLAGEFVPNLGLNGQPYYFFCFDLDNGRLLYKIQSGRSADYAKAQESAFLFLPAKGIFVREEAGADGKLNLSAYTAIP